jgi:hypothetical protein
MNIYIAVLIKASGGLYQNAIRSDREKDYRFFGWENFTKRV